MTQEWYYTAKGQTPIGPVSATELKQLARSGKLAPTDMVQSTGMSKWVPAAKVKGLFGLAAPTGGPSREGDRSGPTTPVADLPIALASEAAGERSPVAGYKEKAVRLGGVAIRWKDRAVAAWNGLSRKGKLGVAAGAATAATMISCAGIAATTTVFKSGVSTPSKADYSDADYAVDFSKIDYSVRPVDYTKGPQGQPLEEQEGVLPNNGSVPPEEAGKLYKQSGFRDASGGFKRHGVRTLWYPEFPGAKKGETKFAEDHHYDGRRHGLLDSYDKGGQKRLERTYQDDQPHGKESIWDEGGRLKSECYFASGKKHGVYKEYHPNGKVMKEGAYKDGKQYGKWIFAYEDGSREAEEYFVVGEKHGKFHGWHPNGQMSLEANFVDGKEVGSHVEWHVNGKKSREYSCRDGLKTGQFTEWHDNGQKSNEGQYKAGAEEGGWVRWFSDGKKFSESKFEAGLQTGVQTDWWSEASGGNIKFISTFTNGVKTREVGFYPALTGENRRRTDLKMHEYTWAAPSGVSQGLWTEWNPDGSIRSIKRY